MYKISNIVTLYNFFFLMLLIGIISNKFGIVSYALIVCFIVVFTFFKIKINQLNPIALFPAFFGSQILFLLGFYNQLESFMEQYFTKFLSFSLLILAINIVVDYILLNFDMSFLQLIYKPEAYSYVGNSLNSIYAVVFYMIYKAPDIYFKMVIFTFVVGNIHYPTLFYSCICFIANAFNISYKFKKILYFKGRVNVN